MARFQSSSTVGDTMIGAKALLLIMIWIHIFIYGVAAISHEELGGNGNFGNKASDLFSASMKNLAPTDGVAVISHEDLLDNMLLPVLRRRLRRNASFENKASDLFYASMENLAPMDGVAAISHEDLLDSMMLPVLRRLRGNASFGNAAPTDDASHLAAVPGVPLEAPASGLYYSSSSSQVVVTGASATLSSVAGPDTLLRRSSSSPHVLAAQIPSFGSSTSSIAAAIIAAIVAAAVILYLLCPSRPNFVPSRRDYDLAHMFHFILHTLRMQGNASVRVDGVVVPVEAELLHLLLSRYFSRYLIREFVRTPDMVIMIVQMPDRSRFHFGVHPHYFMNGEIYENSYIVDITPVPL